MTTGAGSTPAEGLKASRSGQFLVMAGCGMALCAVVGAVAAGFGARIGLWHFRSGFFLLTLAAYGGLAAIIISLAGGVLVVKQRQVKYVIYAFAGVVIGSCVAAIPFSWKITARKVPAIHDISTDTERPPVFMAILPLRATAPNPVEYGGMAVALKQHSAYPDIKTALVALPPDEAFSRALAIAREMGWHIVAAFPAEGRIEATDTTFWFGFTDDVVIRITPADYRSLVDIRSLSRVGRSDVGTNAHRIRAFLKKLAG